MYIIKNAFRNIMRTKGRNILIGIIIAVIACASCIGLSIMDATEEAKTSTMEDLTIEAEISIDRNAMMENMQSEEGKFDMSQFMGFDSVSLSLDEMLIYAKLDTVADFYYIMSSSLSSDTIEPIQTNNRSEAPDIESTEESQNSDQQGFGGQGMPEGMGGGDMGGGRMNPMFGTNGDFTITGYSSETAMVDFAQGNSYINVEDYPDSVMFEEGTSEYQCIITDELATYNDIAVGDEITLYNPNDEEETYTLTVVGVYTNTQSTAGGMMMQSDPANNIYMSYEALAAMVASSEENASVSTNQFGMEISNAISSDVSGTYVFDNVEDYEKFSEDVYNAGLSEEFQVSSTDVQNYEQSLEPLNTLSKTAGYFLIVILAIGALVLIVLNMFSIRERKYEVGVLTAIGMKKGKVAMQFLTEILIVTLLAVVVGGIGGGIASVPVANALLENQISAQEDRSADMEISFGRGEGTKGAEMAGGNMPDMGNMPGGDMPGGNRGGGMAERLEDVPVLGETMEYVDEIAAVVNVKVLLELFGICILLALVAGAASVITIMRYEPLKILSNRD